MYLTRVGTVGEFARPIRALIAQCVPCRIGRMKKKIFFEKMKKKTLIKATIIIISPVAAVIAKRTLRYLRKRSPGGRRRYKCPGDSSQGQDSLNRPRKGFGSVVITPSLFFCTHVVRLPDDLPDIYCTKRNDNLKKK